jgi:hypothetical protein
MIGLLWLALLGWTVPSQAATGRVVKVLPEYLDLKGQNTLSASLYDRDAYQVVLRKHPEKRSGMKFFVQWKTKGGVWEPLTLRLELRGIAEGNLPHQLVMEQRLVNTGGSWFGHWAEFKLTGEEYKRLGVVTAWRVTFWEGRQLLGEQQSFLW